MRSFFAHLKINAFILAAGLVFLFLGNLLIDPEGRFSLVNIRNFNHEKTEAMENGGRAVKAFALERGNYDTIILGTSRVNHGINPTHPVFRSLQAYNAALPGANLYEIYQVFIFARKTHRLKTVLLGMDFSMFSSKQTVTGDFMDSLFAGRNSWLSNLHYLASFQTLLSSFRTVQNNYAGQKSIDTDRGMRDRMLSRDNDHLNHRELFIRVLTRHDLVNNQDSYGGFSYGFDRVEILRSIVKQCRTEGINLYLFITPSHARDLEAIRVLGLYPLFEQWKRDMVNVLAAEAAQHPGEQPIPLWDFSGYNTLTTEDVPSAAEKGKPMQWYWESSHFKKELGDLVLDRLFDYHEPGREVPEDFGVPITTENMETHLSRLREQQRRYHETHPQEVAEVAYLANITSRFRAPQALAAEALIQRDGIDRH